MAFLLTQSIVWKIINKNKLYAISIWVHLLLLSFAYQISGCNKRHTEVNPIKKNPAIFLIREDAWMDAPMRYSSCDFPNYRSFARFKFQLPIPEITLNYLI